MLRTESQWLLYPTPRLASRAALKLPSAPPFPRPLRVHLHSTHCQQPSTFSEPSPSGRGPSPPSSPQRQPRCSAAPQRRRRSRPLAPGARAVQPHAVPTRSAAPLAARPHVTRCTWEVATAVPPPPAAGGAMRRQRRPRPGPARLSPAQPLRPRWPPCRGTVPPPTARTAAARAPRTSASSASTREWPRRGAGSG